MTVLSGNAERAKIEREVIGDMLKLFGVVGAACEDLEDCDFARFKAIVERGLACRCDEAG